MKLTLFALFLLFQNLMQLVDSGEDCSDETRAEIFFLVDCQITPPARSRRAQGLAVVTSGTLRLEDQAPTTTKRQLNLLGTGDPPTAFLSEFYVEFFNLAEDFVPFTESESNLISLVLAASYNQIFGCCRETFVADVDLVESKMVVVDPLDGGSEVPSVSPSMAPIIPQRRRLQRTSEYRSLSNRYVATGGCRCTTDPNLFNDIRSRRRATVGGGSCEQEEFNALVNTTLKNAGLTGFDDIRSTNEFPFFDCNGNEIYEVDGFVDETTCAPSTAPVRSSKKGSSSDD